MSAQTCIWFSSYTQRLWCRQGLGTRCIGAEQEFVRTNGIKGQRNKAKLQQWVLNSELRQERWHDAGKNMAGEHLKMVLCLSLPVLPAAGPPFSALYLGPGSAFQATTCCLVLVLVDLVCCCVIVFFFLTWIPGLRLRPLYLHMKQFAAIFSVCPSPCPQLLWSQSSTYLSVHV